MFAVWTTSPRFPPSLGKRRLTVGVWERHAMNNREFGNFSAWALKELNEKERSFTVGDMRGAEIKAEIDRRMAQRNQRQLLTSTIAAAVSAIGSMIAAVASLIALYLT